MGSAVRSADRAVCYGFPAFSAYCRLAGNARRRELRPRRPPRRFARRKRLAGQWALWRGGCRGMGVALHRRWLPQGMLRRRGLEGTVVLAHPR
jgi:hypothetical protein